MQQLAQKLSLLLSFWLEVLAVEKCVLMRGAGLKDYIIFDLKLTI